MKNTACNTKQKLKWLLCVAFVKVLLLKEASTHRHICKENYIGRLRRERVGRHGYDTMQLWWLLPLLMMPQDAVCCSVMLHVYGTGRTGALKYSCSFYKIRWTLQISFKWSLPSSRCTSRRKLILVFLLFLILVSALQTDQRYWPVNKALVSFATQWINAGGKQRFLTDASKPSEVSVSYYVRFCPQRPWVWHLGL